MPTLCTKPIVNPQQKTKNKLLQIDIGHTVCQLFVYCKLTTCSFFKP